MYAAPPPVPLMHNIKMTGNDIRQIVRKKIKVRNIRVWTDKISFRALHPNTVFGTQGNTA